MTRNFGLSWRGRGEQMLLPLKLYELSLNKSKPRTACADIDVCGLSCLLFPAVLVGFMRMLQGPQCLLCIEGSITSTQKCSRVSTMVALESFFFFFNGWEEFFAHLTRSGLYVAVIEHIIIIVLFPGNIIKKSPNRGMENDPIQNSLVNHQREAFPVNSITGDLVYHHAYLFPQGILQFPAR